MLRLAKVCMLAAFGLSFLANAAAQEHVLQSLMEPHDYVQKRASSYDRSGGNADYREIKPGDTLTLLDDSGPGIITHIWITIASPEKFHLKKLVLRMYWDDEQTPSVETPIGDFFGLGLGDYFRYESIPLTVGSDMALNSFFCMPFQKHARVTVTNQGNEAADHFYFNLDYQAYRKPLPSQTMYFHAQYRQAAPAHGWDNHWANNYVPAIEGMKNLDGRDNYVWLEASWTWAFCRRDDVGTAEPGRLVGGKVTICSSSMAKNALDQWHRFGRLFSGRVGFRRSPVCL